MSRIRRTLQACVLLSSIAALLLAPTAGFAAPLSWQSVDLVLHEDGSPLMIVAGTVPAGAALPAEAVLSAPPGAALQWAGEVLGGPLDQDPTFTPSIESSGPVDVYSFTVSQGPTAQLELLVPGTVTTSAEGKTATIAWTAVQDVPLVRAQVRVPAGSEVTTGTAGGELVPGPTGFMFYQLEYPDVRAGDTIDFTVSYVPPAGGAATTGGGGQTTGSGGSTDALVPALVVAAVLGFALMLFLGRRRPGTADEESDDAEGTHASADDDDEMGYPARSESAGTVEDETGEAVRRPLPKGAITAGVAVVFVVIVFAAISFGSRPQVAGGVISTQIAQVDECTSSTFALAVPEGVSLEDAADEMFDVLRLTQGIGLVKVYEDDPRIEVGYCESNNNEAAIRQILTETGYIAAP